MTEIKGKAKTLLGGAPDIGTEKSRRRLAKNSLGKRTKKKRTSRYDGKSEKRNQEKETWLIPLGRMRGLGCKPFSLKHKSRGIMVYQADKTRLQKHQIDPGERV